MAAQEILAKVGTPQAAQEFPTGECLTDDEVIAFAGGTLESSRHLETHIHLDQCEVCQRLLSEAAHALATAITIPDIEAHELSWHTTFQPGTLVGQRYLIRRFIARGGMGEVYEAFDRELQERVALKTVTSTACDNPGAVRRLKAEVQLARRVSHPNVCRIYDFGTHIMPETGAQLSFLTMEFVDGKTLGQHIRLNGALPVDEARALGRELLEGLNAAHDAGVLHRDFKSDNVMLRDDSGGRCSPLILDFGLARALDAGSRSGSSSTPGLLGTFSYIAPEQLHGQPHTTASDIYSLGLVWFEMLTGELPFESPSSPVGSALARVRSTAAAPSSKNPLVPSDLDTVVLRCLRRAPKDRYKTVREVLHDLAALEARARTVSLQRRFTPLLLGALVGGAAAYMATIPAKHLPVAVTLAPNKPAPRAPASPEVALNSAPTPPAASEPPAATTTISTVKHPAPQPSDGSRRVKVPASVRPLTTASAASETPPPVATGQAPAPAPPKPPPKWENPFDVKASVPAGGGGS